MQDGATQIVEIGVVCPKCNQESVMRVDTGGFVENFRRSVSCAYCQNPWIEFLPGQPVGEAFPKPKTKTSSS
jgi:hypothetical protein